MGHVIFSFVVIICSKRYCNIFEEIKIVVFFEKKKKMQYNTFVFSFFFIYLWIFWITRKR